MNTFGRIYRLTTFGESHGPAIGGIIDGVPPGFRLNTDEVQAELDRRRPGASPLTSQRRESDKVQLLSGIFEGRTLGTPIGFVIPNTDARSADYEAMRNLYRPCHADFTYERRYGLRDYRGGGRASARETACRVVGGAVARQLLAAEGIHVSGFISRIGKAVRSSADEDFAPLEHEVEAARAAGDSVGGIVNCTITGVPSGIGAPLFAKLHSELAAAMMSIPGAKGFDYGTGMQAAECRGSELLDLFSSDWQGGIELSSNHSGGIQGGISNGQPIELRVAFKPTPTLLRDIPTVDRDGRPATLHARGRHDPCIALRALPVVEAMACMTILDQLLLTGHPLFI